LSVITLLTQDMVACVGHASSIIYTFKNNLTRYENAWIFKDVISVLKFESSFNLSVLEYSYLG